MKTKRHRYQNLNDQVTVKRFRDVWKWQQERKKSCASKDLLYRVPEPIRPNLSLLQENRSETTITWIGHSTFLLQVAGQNILTDPVWAKRMGMERRISKPGIAMEQLPEIDLVLISHGHYDHLDLPTLRRLGDKPVYLVPAGLGALLRRKGLRQVEEYGWWEQQQMTGLTCTFVPAQHWVRRTLFDTNTSHWGGWVLEPTDGPTLYFAGDSGYFRGFREIGERFSIEVALLPIGAYDPEWFMSDMHITPEQAIQAYQDMGATLFVPMHYGAFRLANDTPGEALDRLEAEWERRGLAQERLRVMKLGESLLLGSP